MIPLPRRALLAVAAVVDVALHARPRPVAAKALAARHGLPPRHLEPVLQTLVRAGLLKGSRGPRGGYELARERRRMSVGDVVRALAEPAGEGDAAPEASPLVDGIIAPAVTEAGALFLEALDRITIAELCERAEPLARRVEPDFTI
ncbi:MAG: Rrf2 family transcriptional regulator [Methylobacteriaceae bacterium]|nr:Rrf2 family transcriptional regulator [Methylobacteriaceae bacterium]